MITRISEPVKPKTPEAPAAEHFRAAAERTREALAMLRANPSPISPLLKPQ